MAASSGSAERACTRPQMQCDSTLANPRSSTDGRQRARQRTARRAGTRPAAQLIGGSSRPTSRPSSRQGAGRDGEAGPPEDRRARHRVSLPAVRVGDRPHHGQGHPGRPLGERRGEGLSARLRRDDESLPEPPRRISRLRAGGGGAGRHSRAGNLHAAPLGQAGGAHVVHALPQPRGARGSGRLPDRRRARQPSPHPRPVQEGPRPGAAPRHRAGDDVAEEGREGPAERRLLATPTATTSTSSRACGPSTCGSSTIAGRWAST